MSDVLRLSSNKLTTLRQPLNVQDPVQNALVKIIDREHGPISFETAQEMAIVCESRGVSPIMRVADIDRSQIQNALDTGMHGVQVPNIDTISNARDVIHFCKCIIQVVVSWY